MRLLVKIFAKILAAAYGYNGMLIFQVKQTWSPYWHQYIKEKLMELAFFSLDKIDSYLAKYSNDNVSNMKFAKHEDELWVGWILGKFLTSRLKRDCLMGLPVKKYDSKLTLDSILGNNLVDESDNFDVAVVAIDAIKGGKIADRSAFFRIQIKRYKRQDPNTDDFIEFIKDKFINHYAPDKSLNCVILMEPGFKIEILKLEKFVNGTQFKLANIWIIGYHFNQKLDPYLMPIFPKFTKEIWRPSKER